MRAAVLVVLALAAAAHAMTHDRTDMVLSVFVRVGFFFIDFCSSWLRAAA